MEIEDVREVQTRRAIRTLTHNGTFSDLMRVT